MTTELLTIPEFCEIANISKTSTYKLINSGELLAFKVGNKTMIRKEDADVWLANLKPYKPRKPHNSEIILRAG